MSDSSNQIHKSYLAKPWIVRSLFKVFSEAEILFLTKYGAWLSALDSGNIEPTTTAQRHFVQVCNGKKPPKTAHEILWLECKMENLCYREIVLLRQGEINYAAARKRVEELAKQNCRSAINWLQKEGVWENLPSGKSANSAWDIGEIYGGPIFRG